MCSLAKGTPGAAQVLQYLDAPVSTVTMKTVRGLFNRGSSSSSSTTTLVNANRIDSLVGSPGPCPTTVHGKSLVEQAAARSEKIKETRRHTSKEPSLGRVQFGSLSLFQALGGFFLLLTIHRLRCQVQHTRGIVFCVLTRRGIFQRWFYLSLAVNAKEQSLLIFFSSVRVRQFD